MWGIKNTFAATCLILILLSTLASAQYIDPADPRYLDDTRYIDPADPKLNEIDPPVYTDPSDPKLYTPLNQINGVKSLLGNIELYSSDNSVSIIPEYSNSRINLMTDVNAFSGAVNWVQLQNYPTGCPPGQAVQVIGDTLTCISVSSGSFDWTPINTYLNPPGGILDVNVSEDLTINSTKDITTTEDITAGGGSNLRTVNAGGFFGNYNPFLSIFFGYFGIDTSNCLIFSSSTPNAFGPCIGAFDIGTVGNPFRDLFLSGNANAGQFCLGGNCVDDWADVNQSSTDTNCSNNPNCILTGKINTGFDANFNEDVNIVDDLLVGDDVNIGDSLKVGLDINVFRDGHFGRNILADVLIVEKDSTFGPIVVGDENKGFGFPLGKDFCVFGVQGIPCSGVLFNQTTIPSIQATLLGSPSFIAVVDFGTANGSFWGAPRTSVPALADSMKFSTYFTYTLPDGNYPHFTYKDINAAAPVGSRWPANSPRGNLQEFDANGSVTFLQDVNVVSKNTNSARIKLADNNSTQGVDFNITNGNLNIKLLDTNSDLNIMMAFTGINGLRPALTIRGSDGFTTMPNLTQRAIAAQAIHWNSANGNIYALSSDSSFKDDIIDINLVYDTSKIWNLSPKAYKDKASGTQTFGLIAEDVFENAPYLAILNDVDKPYDKNDNPVVSVNYLQMSVIQLQEMKIMRQKEFQLEVDLNAQILLNNEQALKINEMQNQINTMKQEISLLTQIVCPLGNPNPLCQQLANTGNPV